MHLIQTKLFNMFIKLKKSWLIIISHRSGSKLQKQSLVLHVVPNYETLFEQEHANRSKMYSNFILIFNRFSEMHISNSSSFPQLMLATVNNKLITSTGKTENKFARQ